VESAVTTPLEQVINGVEGMTYMQSSSTNSGVSTINVYFDIGRDPDLAAVDVQNRVNQTLGRLPADVRTTGVTVTKQSAGFLGGLGFFSKGNRYSSQFISNYLDLFVRMPSSACPASATSSSSASANTRCACGSTPRAWPPAASPPATW
jgi:HAE1 family hydrophobic/amphiphilic exporter-1